MRRGVEVIVWAGIGHHAMQEPQSAREQVLSELSAGRRKAEACWMQLVDQHDLAYGWDLPPMYFQGLLMTDEIPSQREDGVALLV